MNGFNQYVSDVLDGTILTGRLLRLAVERHVKDMKRKRFSYYFDSDLAANLVDLFPVLFRHYKGKWKDQPFVLEPWQEFVILSMLCWRDKKTHLRRFKKGYVSEARKNGKTYMAACMGTTHAVADQPIENAPEVYCTASKYDQARIVFNDMKALVKQSPELCRFLKPWQNAISHETQNGTIQALGADRPFSGLNPSFVIKDEIHELRERHREFSDTMSTGGAARSQPFELIITTAGDDESTLWLEEVEYAERVLEGVIKDDTLFAAIYCLDKDDDPFDESLWIKANPNLGVSVSIDYLREQAQRAKNDPSAMHRFLRYHGNVKTTSRPRVIDREAWNVLYVEDSNLTGRAYGAIDVGRTYDFCAWTVAIENEERYTIRSKSYTHKQRPKKLRMPYIQQWITEGWLVEHGDDAVDFKAVYEDILEANDKYGVTNWAADTAFAAVFCQWLIADLGDSYVFDFRQTPGNYEPSVNAFMLALGEGRIEHDGDPCLAWQMFNLSFKEDSQGRRMPDKAGRSEFKIDAASTTIMAVGGCVFGGRDDPSVYQSRGLIGL